MKTRRKQILILGLTFCLNGLTPTVLAQVDKTPEHSKQVAQLNQQSLDLYHQKIQAKERAEREKREQDERELLAVEKEAKRQALETARPLTEQEKTAFVHDLADFIKDLFTENEADLFVSVATAQLLLESDFGMSGLSKTHKNYFGIKGSYKGNTVNLTTNEDYGSGLVTINDGFRVYPSLKDSILDYKDLLMGSIYTASRRSTAKNIMTATSNLQGVYATDTSYSNKLITIINKYQLDQYD